MGKYLLGRWLRVAVHEDELHVWLFGRTTVFDWGRVVAGGMDGDIRVVHRVWGVPGSRWLRWISGGEA
jgi:hypothetical protein